MMKTVLWTIAVIGTFFLSGTVESRAQSTELPKYEVAVDFSSLTLQSGTTVPGLGGRFTFNLNKAIALEAAGYFFHGNCDFCQGELTGRVTEGLYGVKAGKRFKKWGLFAKARPGFMRFSKSAVDTFPAAGGGVFFQLHPRTVFAMDLGGVLEFYPSKKVMVRFDLGDTVLRYGRHTFSTVTADPATGALVPARFTAPAITLHSIQFTAGVGFRF